MNSKKDSNVSLNCSVKKHCNTCQPQPLYKHNFLGEFRTELEKKKVLANLGIISNEDYLEWIDVVK